MITLKNAGAKIVTAIIAMGLGAGGAFAAVGHTVNVTLPEAVDVNGATLPGGAYQVSEIELGGGQSAFVFRDDTGQAAAVAQATKSLSPPDVNSWGVSTKTEVTLSPDENGTLHLDKMFVAGDQTGYRFLNLK